MKGLDTACTANAGDKTNEKQQGNYTLNHLALAIGKQANSPNLSPYTPTPIELIKRLSEPAIGQKDGVYFIHCSGNKRTNNDTSDTADILIIDALTQALVKSSVMRF